MDLNAVHDHDVRGSRGARSARSTAAVLAVRRACSRRRSCRRRCWRRQRPPRRSPTRRCEGRRRRARAAEEGADVNARAGRRHDRAALGGDERRRRADADAAATPAPTSARRRGSAAITPLHLASQAGEARGDRALVAGGADVERPHRHRRDAADAGGAPPGSTDAVNALARQPAPTPTSPKRPTARPR